MGHEGWRARSGNRGRRDTFTHASLHRAGIAVRTWTGRRLRATVSPGPRLCRCVEVRNARAIRTEGSVNRRRRGSIWRCGPDLRRSVASRDWHGTGWGSTRYPPRGNSGVQLRAAPRSPPCPCPGPASWSPSVPEQQRGGGGRWPAIHLRLLRAVTQLATTDDGARIRDERPHKDLHQRGLAEPFSLPRQYPHRVGVDTGTP